MGESGSGGTITTYPAGEYTLWDIKKFPGGRGTYGGSGSTLATNPSNAELNPNATD